MATKSRPSPIQSDLPGREPGRLIGYARVSTADQDTQLQLDALTRAGCVIIEREQGVSGTVAAANRPVLGKLLGDLRPGDTLVVWRLDRLGRSMIDLEQTITALKDRGIGFKSVTESIDTTTAVGKMVFHIMGAFAEFERNLIAERTKAGLQAVRDRGQKLGPAFKLTAADAKVAEAMIDQGISPFTIAEQFGVSYHTLWRAICRLRASNLPVPETRESEDGADGEVDAEGDIHSACEEGPNCEERFQGVKNEHENLESVKHDNLETVEDFDLQAPTLPPTPRTLPKHASIGDEGRDPTPRTTAVRAEMIDKLVNDTSMHAHFCDCNVCMAKEEA